MMSPEEQAKAMDDLEKEALEKATKSKGLGDVVAKITKALGIKPCKGCRKRREKLNKIIPFGKS